MISGSATQRIALPADYEVPLFFMPTPDAPSVQSIVCTSGDAYFLHGAIPLVRNRGYHIQTPDYSYAVSATQEGVSASEAALETVAEVSGLMRWANGGLVSNWDKLYLDRRVALVAATGLPSSPNSKGAIKVIVCSGPLGCDLLVSGHALDVRDQEPRSKDAVLWGMFTSIAQYRRRCIDNVQKQENALDREAEAVMEKGVGGEPMSGPVVAVIGGRGCGKTALANQLVHFLQLDCVARSKEGASDLAVQAALLSTDVRSGVDSDLLPGCVSARFTSLPGSSQPLSFFFGSTSVHSNNVNRYLDVCAYATQSLEMLRLARKEIRLGGTVVDTLAITDDASYRAVAGLLDLIKPTHIILLSPHAVALHTEWTSHAIANKLRKSILGIQTGAVQLLQYSQRYPTVGGDVAQHMGDVDCGCGGFSEYFSGRGLEVASSKLRKGVPFYAAIRMPLSAPLQVVRLSDLMILDALTFEHITATSTVTGAQRLSADSTTISSLAEEESEPTEPPRRLVPGLVAAVPFPCSFDALTAINVAGFVAIKEIGEEIAILLCPSPGPLPTKILLVSSASDPVTIPTTVTAAIAW